MHKNMGKSQQIRGDKRRKKELIRKANKNNHRFFINNLMNKYGADFDLDKLKPLYQPGQVYWESYLNGDTKVSE